MGVLFGEHEISDDSQTGLKLDGQLYKGGHMAGNRRMKAFFFIHHWQGNEIKLARCFV